MKEQRIDGVKFDHGIIRIESGGFKFDYRIILIELGGVKFDQEIIRIKLGGIRFDYEIFHHGINYGIVNLQLGDGIGYVRSSNGLSGTGLGVISNKNELTTKSNANRINYR